MSIFKRPSGGMNNVASYEDRAIYVKKGTITKAVVDVNCKFHENSKYADDVAIKFTLQHGERERDYYIGGWWKKEKTAHGFGPPSGLGRAFLIQNVLQSAGVDLDAVAKSLDIDTGLLAENFDADAIVEIFDEAAKQAIGGEVFVLDYVKGLYEGKPSYAPYNVVEGRYSDDESDESVADRLYNRFIKEIERGYGPKNYDPSIVSSPGGDGAVASTSANVSTGAPF